MKFINGGVYKYQYQIFTLVFIDINKKGEPIWGMLCIDRHVKEGMSAPCFQFNNVNDFQFTSNELLLEFNADKWILLDGRLRIEKIDDMRFTEYTIGKLEPMDQINEG